MTVQTDLLLVDWCCCMILSAAMENTGLVNWLWNCCCLVIQVSAAWQCRCPLFGLAGAGLQVSAAWWCWNRYSRFAASLANCCIVVSWYLQRTRGEILRRLSEISSEKSCLREFQWLAGKWNQQCRVCGYDWLDSTSATGYWLKIPLRPLAVGNGTVLFFLCTYAYHRLFWLLTAVFI